MSKPLTTEQLEAMRAVPCGSMPNKLRIALALTQVQQSDVAEQTGIGVPHLSTLVTGKYSNVTVETARKLASFFGCAIEDLFPVRQELAS